MARLELPVYGLVRGARAPGDSRRAAEGFDGPRRDA